MKYISHILFQLRVHLTLCRNRKKCILGFDNTEKMCLKEPFIVAAHTYPHHLCQTHCGCVKLSFSPFSVLGDKVPPWTLSWSIQIDWLTSQPQAALGSHTRLACPWALEIQTQLLMLPQQSINTLNHLPSQKYLFWKVHVDEEYWQCHVLLIW